MSLFKAVLRGIIETPGTIIETVAKETVALPTRFINGLEAGIDVVEGTDKDKRRRR